MSLGGLWVGRPGDTPQAQATCGGPSQEGRASAGARGSCTEQGPAEGAPGRGKTPHHSGVSRSSEGKTHRWEGFEPEKGNISLSAPKDFHSIPGTRLNQSAGPQRPREQPRGTAGVGAPGPTGESAKGSSSLFVSIMKESSCCDHFLHSNFSSKSPLRLDIM